MRLPVPELNSWTLIKRDICVTPSQPRAAFAQLWLILSLKMVEIAALELRVLLWPIRKNIHTVLWYILERITKRVKSFLAIFLL